MRVSCNWLKEYLPLDVSAGELATILTSLGLEVSSMEHIESIKGGLKGVVAGKVMECQKHPNADRLYLTKVDIGTGGLLQIVCGAPNVAKGQTVWVATVGTTLYPAGTDKSLLIAKTKVRGEFSEGMICAEDELGLGEDHSGILILSDEIKIGTPASEYYSVTTDDVIEIELTPNRSDAICHLGVARDLAAWFAINKGPLTLRLPQVSERLVKTASLSIDVEVRNTDACPRYCGVTVTGITIKESPSWLQNHLRSIDVRPINNIVDITNFVLHEMGQPLHAFDADKIKGNKVLVQTLPEGTPFVTLDQVERKLSAEDLMICDGDSHGMCIAGVYGGIGTGISETTTNVFLESAHFHPGWIRRTSMRHDLRTEAARTFEKTTDPNISNIALRRAVDLILQLAGGHVASDVIDVYPVPVQKPHVSVRWEMIRRLIGVDIPQDKVLEIFNALDMQVLGNNGTTVIVSVPTNKADVTREADVIEEILRIYGFDNVQLRPKMEIAMTTSPPRTMSGLRHDLANFLAAHGFLEMMGMSLIESRQYTSGPLQISDEARILIDNTSNVHLDLMRHTMLSTAIEAVRFNQNRMQSDLMLSEFGRTYQIKNGQFSEEERLSLSISGTPLKVGWRHKDLKADFFFLKKYVHLVLEHLGIVSTDVKESDDAQWEYALEYRVADKSIVIFGKISQTVMRQYDLKSPIFFADFNMSTLLALHAAGKVQVSDIPRFPAVHRDIAVVLSRQIPFQQVEKCIASAGGAMLIDCSLFDIYENPDAMGADKRSLAISLVFQDPERTLTDAEVSKAIEQILSALEKETGAVLR